jgi:hypothetical protein
MPDLLGEYCSPEMAELMREFDALLSDVHLVHEVTMRNPITGQVTASYYRPIERDLKAELKALVINSHGLGYTEATADWG